MGKTPFNEGHEKMGHSAVVTTEPSAPPTPYIGYADTEGVQSYSAQDEETWYDWRNVSPDANMSGTLKPTSQGKQSPREGLQEKNKQDYAFVSWILLLVMGCLLVWEFAQGSWEIDDPKINPMIGPTADVLIDSGARRGDLVIVDGQWWRLYSSTFIHAGFMHYIISFILVTILVKNIEKKYGSIKMSLIFLSGAIFGAVVGVVFVPTGIGLGATAGFITLYGAEFGATLAYRMNEKGALKRCIGITVIVGLTLGLGIIPFIDNWATSAGALIGLLLGIAMFAPLKSTKIKLDHPHQYIRITAAVLAFSLFISCYTTLYTSITGGWCGNKCVNFTCVELPKNSQDKWWYCDMCHLYGFEYSYRSADGSGYITCPDDSVVSFTDLPKEEFGNTTVLYMCETRCMNLNFGFRREFETIVRNDDEDEDHDEWSSKDHDNDQESSDDVDNGTPSYNYYYD